MNLDNLEFDAKDFAGPDCPHWGSEPCDCVLWESDKLAEIANRILREKLSKAPEVRGDNNGSWDMYDHPEDTHRARLVAIEEIQT